MVYIRPVLISNDRKSTPSSLRGKKDEKDRKEVDLAVKPNNQEGQDGSDFRYSWI